MPLPVTPTPAEQMPALTGIRFPLALWVVVHHLTGPNRMFEPLVDGSPTVRALIDAAWVALSVFFAISGFVLARRYGATRWSRPALARYAVARFGRVYPVYLISLLILLPIVGEHLRGDALGSTADRLWLFTSQVLLLQGWHPPLVNWNTPAWSLSAEVFFYALFPLVIVPLRTRSARRIAVAVVLAFAIPIALRLTIDPPIPKALLYFGDFLIGLAAGLAFDRVAGRIDRRRLGTWLSAAAAAGGILLLLYRDQLGSFFVFDAGVRLVSVLLVVGLALGGGTIWRVLASRPVVLGGRASYAIYILHVPVLWLYERSVLRAVLPPVEAGLVFVVLVVALSLVVLRGIEEPANVIIRDRFARRRPSAEGPVRVLGTRRLDQGA